MQLRISLQDGVPIYQQIVEQVKYLIAGGRLRPNDDLPPIRILAEQLRINPNTVARAYMELEREGLINMRQGFGSKVAEIKSRLPRREKLIMLIPHIDALLADSRNLDVPLEEVIGLLRERDIAMKPESLL